MSAQPERIPFIGTVDAEIVSAQPENVRQLESDVAYWQKHHDALQLANNELRSQNIALLAQRDELLAAAKGVWTLCNETSLTNQPEVTVLMRAIANAELN